MNLITDGTKPTKTAEHSLLTLARRQRTFRRDELEAQLKADGIETCYEWAIEKCISSHDIEPEPMQAGVWRSCVYPCESCAKAVGL